MNKNIVIGVLAVLALLGTGYLYLNAFVPVLGGSGYAHYQNESFLQGLKVGTRDQFSVSNAGVVKAGTNGTSFARLNGGLCDLNFGNAPSSIAASSTVSVDCQASNLLSTATLAQAALPGVTSGDAVFVQLASSTPTTHLGLKLNGCSASTTAGYITCGLTNMTGTTITPATTTAHLLNYWVADNQ